MFDPATNANYAARFLSDLYSELGNWSEAAGAYHSRTPKYAQKYAARFDRIRERTPREYAAQTPSSRAIFGPPQRLDLNARLRAGPLVGQGGATLGSLVPLNRGDSPARVALAFFE